MPNGYVTPQETYDALLRNGADPGTAQTLTAISRAESSGYTAATNNFQGHSYMGLWQIGEFWGVDPSRIRSGDLDYQAQQALRVLGSQGLTAWETYTNGAFQKYMNGDPSAQNNYVQNALALAHANNATKFAAITGAGAEAAQQGAAAATGVGLLGAQPSPLDSPQGANPFARPTALDSPGMNGSPLDSPGGETVHGNPIDAPVGFDKSLAPGA